jgi:CII-binding regulator of phage lambda lysogenization HflD
VEGRLTRLLTSSQDIERRLASERDHLDFIAHELAKLKDQETTFRERERVLRMLCELVRMEDLRK